LPACLWGDDDDEDDDVASENSPGVEVDLVSEAIVPATKNSPGVEVDRAQEAISQVAKTSPGVEVDRAQEAISQVAKTSPGVEVDQVEEPLPECSHCFDDGYFEDESGLIKSCHCSIEPKLSRQKAQSAIVPATENSPGVDCVYCNSPEYESLRDGSYRCYRCQPETDQNLILTGISLSDRFLARYTPPQSETLQYQITDDYEVDTDGQLSLFEVHVQSLPEPPDPDDFESLDAFREAIALWDAQNLEPLAVSMDSMCEWAPCPEEWYEPEPESLPLKA